MCIWSPPDPENGYDPPYINGLAGHDHCANFGKASGSSKVYDVGWAMSRLTNRSKFKTFIGKQVATIQNPAIIILRDAFVGLYAVNAATPNFGN